MGLLTLKPGHEEEDHDHIMCNGRQVLCVEYGEVDAQGRGVNCLGPRDVARLVRAVNRTHAKELQQARVKHYRDAAEHLCDVPGVDSWYDAEQRLRAMADEVATKAGVR